MATPKQQKLIKILSENIGKKDSSKTLGQMLREAGYSDIQSLNPKKILETKAVKEGVSDFVKMLDDKRRMAVTHITEDKLEKASARDNAYITDILTKNHQLLTGEETERQGVSINVIDSYDGDNDTI